MSVSILAQRMAIWQLRMAIWQRQKRGIETTGKEREQQATTKVFTA